MKYIDIVISAKGEITIQPQGFSGSSCRDASRLLEQALGTVSAERLTAEFYDSQTQVQQQRLA